MFDNINPATKQYVIFSAIISFFLSILVNFILVEGLKGLPIYGFPIVLNGLKDFNLFLARCLNTGIYTIILIVPIYLALMWLNRRMRGI